MAGCHLKARREHAPSGTRALAQLCKKHTLYGHTAPASQHQSLLALAIDEPTTSRVVPLLAALPASEAAFYAREENVVQLEGKSPILFAELQEQFGFVGGSVEQYVKYFHRADFPRDTWTFRTSVKAVGGFTVVPKKDPTRQRKILMDRSCNYLWCDPRSRGDHGLAGGEALSRVRVQSNVLGLACFDESNAFSAVMMPAWVWTWQAVPPLPAWMLWSLLPARLRRRVTPFTFFFPCYQRMAMGNSHAVHLLMAINTGEVGRCFRAA